MAEQITYVPLDALKLSRVTAPKPDELPVAPSSRAGRLCRNIFALIRARSVVTLPWQAWLLLGVLFLLFVGIGVAYFWVATGHRVSAWLPIAMTVLWVISGVGALSLFYWIWREFACFGDELFRWAECLRHNDLTARMPIKRRACPSRRIREQINSITEDYQAVSRMQQQRMQRQERNIKQKNHHLTVLHDVATAINQASNLDDLFKRFLQTLKEVMHAEAATVRLLDSNNIMRLVASVGLDAEVMQRETTILATQCTCGKAVDDQEIKLREDVSKCEHLIGKALFAQRANIEMFAVPLQYRGKILGIYNLFVARERHADLAEEQELLLSIGRHLGMAIEKAHIEEEAHTLSIMEERTRMAHELHDSLAQTLASLRFKVRLFDDSLHRGHEQAIWSELEGLEKNIDEAYAELRSLITHFRAPFDGKGVVRAVEALVERFRKETSMDVFFYHNWSFENLSQAMELEVVRIVQEALNNVRKHSQAETVRILMHSSEQGRCSVLVEDDGIGLPDPLPQPNPVTGEHIGLHIMQERAAKLGGEIHFESDPDEGGTLLQLSFDAPDERKLSQLMKGLSLAVPQV